MYSECSSVSGCGVEWHTSVDCDSADLLITLFSFTFFFLYTCFIIVKGDNSGSYDFLNLVMCFVNKSQIKFFLKYINISAVSWFDFLPKRWCYPAASRAPLLFLASCLPPLSVLQYQGIFSLLLSCLLAQRSSTIWL